MENIKNILNYFYLIDVADIIDYHTYYIVYDKNDKLYFFVLFKRSEEELKDILKIVSELHNNKIYVHNFVPTNNGSYIVNYGGERYVLLEIFGLLEEKYSVLDMINFNNKYKLGIDVVSKYKNVWADLWSKKIDYFQYQISELGIGKNSIINSFSYFVGLAENAIAYVVNTEIENGYNLKSKIVLSHRRIFYPNYKINYLNPLCFIFYYEVRDVAEYVKSAFYAGVDALSILNDYLNYRNLNNYEARLLYGRLLYPSYYFDYYEDVILNKSSDDALLHVVDNVGEYELFLCDAYYLINKYVKIPSIDWIVGNH